jgi:hypothetical protein
MLSEKMIEVAGEILDVLTKHNLINDIAVRDYHIRQDYRKLTQQENTPTEKARYLLAEKYFLSEKHIQTIVYDLQKKYKKEMVVK